MILKEKRIPLFIEFAGLPGVGKTTIASEIINRLKKSGFNIPNTSTLESLYINEIIINSKTSSNILKAALKWTVSIFSDLKISVLIFRISLTYGHKGFTALKVSQGMRNGIGFYRLLKKSSSEIIILDEGFLHKIFSLMVFQNVGDSKTLDNSMIQQIIEFYEENNIFLCHLKVSSEVSNDRLIKRGIQTVESNYKNIIKDITENGPNFTSFLEEFKKRYTNSLDIDTSENISKNVEIISEKIVLLYKENFENKLRA